MIPSAQDVRAGLQRYDPEATKHAVRKATKGELPMWSALQQTLGTWYSHGPQVGDETLDPWCWCHAYNKEGVGGVLRQIEAVRQWRLDLFAWLDRRLRLDGPRDVVEVEDLDDVLLDLVGQLVELGLHDAWYVHVHVAIAWMLDHLGISRSPTLMDRLDALCDTSFRSWCEPSPSTRASFAEAATWMLIEAQLDAG
jgi:hypothetical protein